MLYEQLHPYFAYLAPDKEYLKMMLADMAENNMADFWAKTWGKALSQEPYFIREGTAGGGDWIFISSVRSLYVFVP